MSAEARIAEINATIAALEKERADIQATVTVTSIPEWVDNWLGQLASAFDDPVPDGLRAKLLAGLSSYPTRTVTKQTGKSYDPDWTVTTYTYSWNDCPVTYTMSAHPYHKTEYKLDSKWLGSTPLTELYGWEALAAVEDNYKIAAIMHWPDDRDE